MKTLVKFIGIIFIIALIAGVIYRFNTLKGNHCEEVEVGTIVIIEQEDSLAVEKIFVENE